MMELDMTTDKSLCYSKKWLRQKIEERYGHAMYFTNDERRATLLCFKDNTSDILREYQANQGHSDEEKAEAILDAAWKLLETSIKSKPHDNSRYPSIGD